jgi:hypothetical protein
MPYALCPIPYALYPMPGAGLCPAQAYYEHRTVTLERLYSSISNSRFGQPSVARAKSMSSEHH